MTTKATTKEFTFTVSAKLDTGWTVFNTYRTRRVALPPALTAFNHWYEKHCNPDVHCRIDGEADGENVYQDERTPVDHQPETREEAELRMRKLFKL